MSNNPKICIAFTGGSAGDFFTQLIYNQLLDKSITPMVDNNGMCLKHPGEKFKKACEAFFLEKFKTNYFTTIDIEPVVNTHHCYQEIIDLFPDCCFYYIDSSQYIPLTVDVFIKKRLDPFNQTLLEWLHETNPFLKNKKMLDMTDNQIRTVMINDYNKCLKEWKKLNLIQQLTYFNEKIDEIKKTIKDDEDELDKARLALSSCYLAIPYVDLVKTYEITNQQDKIILKDPETFNNPPKFFNKKSFIN